MKKRILSWLLIMSMAFSCLPVTALAAEGTTPTFTPYYEEFDGFKDGDKIVVSGSKIVNHYCTGSTYTITRATVDGYSVMQMNTKDSGRAWVKTKQADFTGDFTVKTRLMVAAGHSSTAIDLRFLGIEKGKTAAVNGNPMNLTFRISGSSIRTNSTVSSDGVGGVGVFLKDAKGNTAKYTQGTWLNARIDVFGEEKRAVGTFTTDDGVLVGQAEVTGLTTVDAAAFSVDTAAKPGDVYVDYISVDPYNELYTEDFDYYENGENITVSSDANLNYHTYTARPESGYTIKAIQDGDKTVMQVQTDGNNRVTLKTPAFTGDYVWQTRVKIGSDVTSTTDIRIPYSGGNYVVRFAGGKFQQAVSGSYAANTWYVVRLFVSATKDSVQAMVYDDNGNLVSEGTKLSLSMDDTTALTITMDHYGADGVVQSRYWDYFKVSREVVKDPVFKITTGEGVSVDKDTAEEGETITVTATAPMGYEVGSIKVDGVAIQGNTFTMPGKDVYVEAEYVRTGDSVTPEPAAKITGNLFCEDFDGYADGAQIIVANSQIINHYSSGTYSVTRATVDGASVMQMNTTGSGRAFVKTDRNDFAGDFTVKTRLMVAEGHSSTAIDLRFMGIEKGKTSSGSAMNLTFRLSGSSIRTNSAVDAAGVGGVGTVLKDLSGNTAKYTKGTWLNARIDVFSGEKRAVGTFTKDDGTLVGKAEVTDLTSVVPTAFAVDSGAKPGDIYVDYISVSTYDEIYNEEFDYYRLGDAVTIRGTTSTTGDLSLQYHNYNGVPKAGEYEFTVADVDDKKVLYTYNKQGVRATLKTPAFSGDYVWQTRLRIADTTTAYTDIRQGEKDANDAYIFGNFTLRFNPNGKLAQNWGSGTYAYNTWYVVKIYVSATEGTVYGELYDDNGFLLYTTSKVTGLALGDKAYSFTIDQGAQQGAERYFDYFKVTRNMDPDFTITTVEGLTVDKTTAKVGETVTITEVPKNFEVEAFKVNGVVIQGNTFQMPGRDAFVTAVPKGAVPLTADTVFAPNGIYYLEENVELKESVILEEGEYTILLDGHTLSGAEAPYFTVGEGATLNIMDRTADLGRILGKENGGDELIVADGTLNLFGGTITGHTNTGTEAGDGGAVKVNAGGVFAMSGGVIRGNGTGGRGSAVNVGPDGTFAMSGGYIPAAGSCTVSVDSDGQMILSADAVIDDVEAVDAASIKVEKLSDKANIYTLDKVAEGNRDATVRGSQDMDGRWHYYNADRLRVLVIGNSFGRDSSYYISHLSQAVGMPIENAYLHKDSACLRHHASLLAANPEPSADANDPSVAYYYYKANMNPYSDNYGTLEQKGTVNAAYGLADGEWDVVILHQGTATVAYPGTYNSDLTYLADAIKAKQPNSELYWNMTWAYEDPSTGKLTSERRVKTIQKYFYNEQATMYNAIVDATAENFVGENAAFADIFTGWFPVGTALQTLRGTEFGDNVTRDGYHLSLGGGRLTAAMTILKVLRPEADLSKITMDSVSDFLAISISAIGEGENNPKPIGEKELELIVQSVASATADLSKAPEKLPAKVISTMEQATGGAHSTVAQVPAARQLYDPDVAHLSDGTMIVSTYENILPEPTSDTKKTDVAYDGFGAEGAGRLVVWAGDATATNWSFDEPMLVVDQDQLENWGIVSLSDRYEKLANGELTASNYIVFSDPRDPDLTVANIDTDGDGDTEEVLLFTFWVRNYMNKATAQDHTYLTWSVDDGKTWETPVAIKGANGEVVAKNGDIAVFENGQILVPTYAGGKAYANLLSWTESGWTQEAVTEVGAFGEASFVAPDAKADVVYGLADNGAVIKSENRGATWNVVATESGTVKNPSLAAIDKDRVYAAWDCDNEIFGKIFVIDEGWQAAEAVSLYEGGEYTIVKTDGKTFTTTREAGAPAAQLLKDGETVFVVSYDTAYHALVGTKVAIEGCDHAEDMLTVTKEAKEATCDEAGWTEEKTCSCGEIIVASKPVEAKGHNLVDVPGKDATYTEPGYKPYKDCSRCDYTEGYEEIPVLTVPTGTIEQSTYTLSLDEVIFINDYVVITGFEGIDLAEKTGLMVFKTDVEEPYFDEKLAIPGAVYDARYNEWMVRTGGIAAKEYADELYVYPYVELPNGEYFFGEKEVFSVRSYCDKVFASATTRATLKRVCAAMLHYGAAAQVRFNYKVENLANAGLAAEWAAEEFKTDMLTATADFTTNIVSTGDVVRSSTTLSLDGAIVMNYYYKCDGIDVDKAELLLWYGETEMLTEANAANADEPTLMEYTYSAEYGAEYFAQSAGIATKKYGETIYACVKVTDTDGGVHYSEIFKFSPEAYAERMLNNARNGELVKRMVVYGEAAAAHFAK